ncbi:hypothetical protein F2Q69_00037853 [Brassica cretica]|uniref:Uncharacterized protein n=1 Tax=Brassica cretica TaxID=69181 RepID=A0A8S9SGQ2_BRACR|nr:hypothetical protein F2Q69_00037853 [Brassica cretica]
MASLGDIEESNDLVNHVGGVFRYFIVDVVDPGSTPDVARCSRELGEKFLSHEQGLNQHILIDSWISRLEEERHMKKVPSEIEETRKVKEIFGLQEKKENCWTFFATAAQVYGGRIHESVESVEMISSYEIRVSLEFSRGARICYCVRRTSGYSQDKMMVFLVSVKGVADDLKGIDSCGVRLNRWRCQIDIDSGWKHVCFRFSAWDSVVVCFGFSGHMRGRTNGSTGYHGCRAVQSDVQGKVFIQIVTKEILRMRSLVSTGY